MCRERLGRGAGPHASGRVRASHSASRRTRSTFPTASAPPPSSQLSPPAPTCSPHGASLAAAAGVAHIVSHRARRRGAKAGEAAATPQLFRCEAGGGGSGM